MAIDKIQVDFQIIDTKDPKILTLADISVWSVIAEKPAVVEILLPGESEPVKHYLNKNQLNIYNSVFLGLACPSECEGEDIELTDLPDGIYEITVKGSPDTYSMTRKYLRTELTQLELDKMYINLNLLCDRKDMDLLNILTDIDLLLKAAHANVRYDNTCKAQELLFKAQELIEKAKKCNGCVGV
ncbi:MAG: hypothetical protein PQJ49_14165 [Sphaerochaetaceae bacterium]|nr:hypothetical protein [Sphaerochaetaceae bacterium]